MWYRKNKYTHTYKSRTNVYTHMPYRNIHKHQKIKGTHTQAHIYIYTHATHTGEPIYIYTCHTHGAPIYIYTCHTHRRTYICIHMPHTQAHLHIYTHAMKKWKKKTSRSHCLPPSYFRLVYKWVQTWFCHHMAGPTRAINKCAGNSHFACRIYIRPPVVFVLDFPMKIKICQRNQNLLRQRGGMVWGGYD